MKEIRTKMKETDEDLKDLGPAMPVENTEKA
jgi:hypothetical protein